MPWRKTNGSASIAALLPCCNGLLYEPSRYAFAAFSHRLQPFSNQLFSSPKPCWTAHTLSRSFAIPPFKSSVNYLVKRNRMEVCPLSRGMMFQSLSGPITGRRSLFPSLLTCISVSSPHGRLSDFHRREYRLTTFHLNKLCGLGFRLSAGSSYVHVSPLVEGDNRLHTFWFRPISNFGLLSFNGVYQRFTLH